MDALFAKRWNELNLHWICLLLEPKLSVTFTLQLHVVARTNHPAPHSIGYFPTGITDRTLAKQITRFETTRNRREFVRPPLGNSGSLRNQVARRGHFFFFYLFPLYDLFDRVHVNLVDENAERYY